MTLIINTAFKNKIFIALAEGEKFYKKSISRARADRLLILIDKILKSKKMKMQEIKKIIVVSGPGSFTALRQGVLAANTLGFVLGVPAVGVRLDEFRNEKELLAVGYKKIEKIRVGEMVLPFYGREPNITTPRISYV